MFYAFLEFMIVGMIDNFRRTYRFGRRERDYYNASTETLCASDKAAVKKEEERLL